MGDECKMIKWYTKKENKIYIVFGGKNLAFIPQRAFTQKSPSQSLYNNLLCLTIIIFP